MSKKRIGAILVIILLLVILPTLSYFFLRSGVEARDLRYVDPFAYQTEEGDTIRPVFTNQNGDTLTSQLTDGKLVLGSFLFYRCDNFIFCDSIPYYMEQIQSRFAGRDDIELLTYTINPSHDTTAILKKWADEWNADPDIWHFVRGKQPDVYQVILGEFFGEVKYANGIVRHMQPDRKVVLLDKQGLIKGYYQLESDEDLETVIAAIEKWGREPEQ